VSSIKGYTLIEMLLVTVIAAVCITLGVRYYLYCQQQQYMQQLIFKVQSLQLALDAYMHQVGCNQAGIFPDAKMNPSISDLDTLSQYAKKTLLPDKFISSYGLKIITLPAATDKPLYQLQVIADLHPTVTDGVASWLAKKLDAQQAIDNSHHLIWGYIPGVLMARSSDNFWGLRLNRERFRRLQQHFSKQQYSNAFSYCSH
jgi:prepilin-type N-terminal cleavage/methylation domain-containing protein